MWFKLGILSSESAPNDPPPRGEGGREAVGWGALTTTQTGEADSHP
jgi:hypothetical protein